MINIKKYKTDHINHFAPPVEQYIQIFNQFFAILKYFRESQLEIWKIEGPPQKFGR